jgi:hypothetical protein
MTVDYDSAVAHANPANDTEQDKRLPPPRLFSRSKKKQLQAHETEEIFASHLARIRANKQAVGPNIERYEPRRWSDTFYDMASSAVEVAEKILLDFEQMTS